MDAAAAMADAPRNRLTDGIAGLGEKLGDVDLAELRADFEESVRARPLLSIGLAAMAGFLIGRLLRD